MNDGPKWKEEAGAIVQSSSYEQTNVERAYNEGRERKRRSSLSSICTADANSSALLSDPSTFSNPASQQQYGVIFHPHTAHRTCAHPFAMFRPTLPHRSSSKSGADPSLQITVTPAKSAWYPGETYKARITFSNTGGDIDGAEDDRGARQSLDARKGARRGSVKEEGVRSGKGVDSPLRQNKSLSAGTPLPPIKRQRLNLVGFPESIEESNQSSSTKLEGHTSAGDQDVDRTKRYPRSRRRSINESLRQENGNTINSDSDDDDTILEASQSRIEGTSSNELKGDQIVCQRLISVTSLSHQVVHNVNLHSLLSPLLMPMLGRYPRLLNLKLRDFYPLSQVPPYPISLPQPTSHPITGWFLPI